MELITRATSGRPVEHHPRKEEIPETFPKGRTCSARKVCGAKELSIYNPGPRCHACADAEGKAERDKARRQIAELQRRGYSDEEIEAVMREAA